MAIIERDYGEIQDSEDSGRMIWLYGETGVGKTVSVLATAPDPLLMISCEPRDVRDSLVAADRGRDFKFRHVICDTWEDIIEYFADPDRPNLTWARTILLDGVSHLMNVSLTSELEDQAFEAREDKEKVKKKLTQKVKMSEEGYGALGSWMFRLTTQLGKWSQRGKVVVFTSLITDSPKWNRLLSGAPLLAGKMYSKNMPGYFDLIGLVEHRYDRDGNKVYPPRVKFEGEDFTCKFTGRPDAKKSGLLNISKIVNGTLGMPDGPATETNTEGKKTAS